MIVSPGAAVAGTRARQASASGARARSPARIRSTRRPQPRRAAIFSFLEFRKSIPRKRLRRKAIPGKDFGKRKTVPKKSSASAASISNNSFKIRPTRSSSSTLPSARQCVNQEFQRMFGYSAAADPGQIHRRAHLPARSRRRSPMDRPMPRSAANASPSKPSAAAKTAPCSMFPFPPLL